MDHSADDVTTTSWYTARMLVNSLSPDPSGVNMIHLQTHMSKRIKPENKIDHRP
jgi:hypothetical protein